MSGNLAYQDEFQEELIDGALVMMSPAIVRHNLISFNIANIFANHLRGKRCTPFADGTLVRLTERDRFIPDMMIVCDPDKIKEDHVAGAPDLVVEVLSPGTAKRDRGYKKDVYERCGVREYWIVSPESKSVEQYLLREGRFVLNDVYTVYPAFMLESMAEEERAAVRTCFRCSLYDDLDIRLDDVFDRVDHLPHSS